VSLKPVSRWVHEEAWINLGDTVGLFPGLVYFLTFWYRCVNTVLLLPS
jgi:hypothetical protein